MGSVYSGSRSGTIFAATTDIMILHAASGEYGKILEVGWSGEATTTTAMRTRFTRASTVGTAPTTAVDTQEYGEQSGTQLLDLVTTVTSPTYRAGSLLPNQSWNLHGGHIRWVPTPRQEIMIVGAAAVAQICLRNEVGAGNGSAGIVWEE